MSDFLSDLPTTFGGLTPASGYNDIVALVRDSPCETALNADASLIRPQDIFTVSSLSIEVKQVSVDETRYAGEGAESETLAIGTEEIRVTLKFPLLAPLIGWVEPTFAAVWDLARFATWGTPTATLGRLISPAPGLSFLAGQAALQTDNVADFAGLLLPFAAQIVPTDLSLGEATETVIVVSVSKRARTLTLASPTTCDHSSSARIVVRPKRAGANGEFDGPEREPAFSLLSLREGLISPCLVDKVTIDAEVDKPVTVTVELVALSVIRSPQIGLRAAQPDLVAAAGAQPPVRVVNAYQVTVASCAAEVGLFGLASAIGDPLVSGYQGLVLPSVLITGVSITVDNRIKPIFTNQSLSDDDGERQRENSLPFTLASEGRTVSGKLSYLSPLKAWQVAERLAGPSSRNGGGLQIDYGTCRLTMPEIAWAPSSGEGEVEGKQTRSLTWTLVADQFLAMPPLEYSSLRFRS